MYYTHGRWTRVGIDKSDLWTTAGVRAGNWGRSYGWGNLTLQRYTTFLVKSEKVLILSPTTTKQGCATIQSTKRQVTDVAPVRTNSGTSGTSGFSTSASLAAGVLIFVVCVNVIMQAGPSDRVPDSGGGKNVYAIPSAGSLLRTLFARLT
eukprot:292809-Pyramimonas_sp.AAC.1